jgi:uncharacterized hydrophobic protein (TIGR00271 family)
VLHVRVFSPSELTDDVTDVLRSHPDVSALAVFRGASVRPEGDVVLADIPREAANDVIESVRALGVTGEGTVHVEPVQTWLSEKGLEAERHAPGSSSDAVVWAEVVENAYGDAELNWTYLTFMTLATLLASIAIVLDSQILVIGAMVLGPEFGAVAALGVALVRRRPALFRFAVRTLVLGFVCAILLTTCVSLIGRGLGWVNRADIVGHRPGTSFIYSPDKWSITVAVIAGAAGVLSLTSARLGGLSGVFISVTTVPAAGNVALGLVFGAWSEVRGSGLQLLVNIAGMAVAGWLTLVVQQSVWSRVSIRRAAITSGRRTGA